MKKIDHYPINSENYEAGYYQTLEEVPGPLLPEKNSKTVKKMQTFQKLLKFVIL